MYVLQIGHVEDRMNRTDSVDIEKRPLIELAQFVLNRTTENVREELHDYLIEVVLCNSTEGKTREEIKSAIEKEFGFSEFPFSIVDLAIARLDKKLEKQGSPISYVLSNGRKKELDEMFHNQKMLRDYFVARVLAKIASDYGDISDVASNEIISCLLDFLAVAFDNLSVGLSSRIFESQEDIKGIADTLEVNELLYKSFDRIEDGTLKRDSIEVVRIILSEYDEKTSLFLYSLAQSHALLKILNIDPQCQSLERDIILSDMVVYLDTNIAINLICEEAYPIIHESCVKLINLTKELGIKCVISVRTTKEIEKHLETSEEMYQSVSNVPDERRKKMLKYVQDEVIREYWTKLNSNPGLKWPAFLGRLRSFSSILAKRYSIEIDKRVYDNISSDPKFDELSKLIMEANRAKSSALVEHDCFHLLLIDHLRNETKGEEIIPKRWFLTRDKSLNLVEKLRMINEKRRPSSVHIDVWLQMISPLLSPKIATEQASQVFSRCLSSDLLPSFPRISPIVLAKIVGPCLDHTDLSIKEIRQIIGDTYLLEHFEELGEKRVEVYLTDKLLQIREQRHKQEIEQAAKEREKLMEEVERSEREKKKLLDEMDKLHQDKEGLIEEVGIERHFGRYLAGGVVFFIVWIFTYSLILLPTMQDSFVACILAILISLIFGFLIGFRRYDWILQRFLSLVEKLTKR
jgi:hypothetical protein